MSPVDRGGATRKTSTGYLGASIGICPARGGRSWKLCDETRLHRKRPKIPTVAGLARSLQWDKSGSAGILSSWRFLRASALERLSLQEVLYRFPGLEAFDVGHKPFRGYRRSSSHSGICRTY